MPGKPKTAAKGQIPATANPADNEPEADETETVVEWPQDALDHISTLETALKQAEERATFIEGNAAKMGERIRELENLCEQYQNDETVKHHEARDVTWSDIEINGFQFNFTRREGETVDQSINAILDHVRVMQTLKSMEKVVTLRVGLKGDWKSLKGFDKPTNGKPTADEQPPADEKPATPKGNQPPAANKPNMPPPANKPAQPAAPQGNQPPTGKVQGAKASQLYTGLIRHQIDGLNTYDLTFILANGKPADKPIPVSKRDTAALEKALANVGWTPDNFELGTAYDVKILNEWTWGKPTNADKPDGPRFHDGATFTVQVETANEEMPF